MENSYKFFNNKDCKYLPCHETENVDDFNCLFCYCPLYMMWDKCGGNFRIEHGVKDCSKCKIPHVPNGYEYINKKLSEWIEDKAMAELTKGV